jgi:acetyltransferase
MGGVLVEVLKEVGVGLPPLNQVLARRLIERTIVSRYFSDPKTPQINVKLVEEILVKFSQLVIDFPEISEMEINPLIVDKEKAVAIDTRIIINPGEISTHPHLHEHLVITPYPRRYISQWELRDKTPVILRPIKPEDEALLHNLFTSFSEETMRFRFFQLIREMPHDMLIRYCNIDYNREIAIVAEINKSDERKIIGVARIITQPDRRHGEFAVAVGDQWQGQGLGSKLVDTIIKIAKDLGLESIEADVLIDNVKMHKLCTNRGFTIEPVDGETTKATLNLPPI